MEATIKRKDDQWIVSTTGGDYQIASINKRSETRLQGLIDSGLPIEVDTEKAEYDDYTYRMAITTGGNWAAAIPCTAEAHIDPKMVDAMEKRLLAIYN